MYYLNDNLTNLLKNKYDICLENIDSTSKILSEAFKKENDYSINSVQYKNKIQFQDREKQSGDILDFISDLENNGIEYSIYDNTSNNGCTIFYN